MKKIIFLLLIGIILLPTSVFADHKEIHIHIWIGSPPIYTSPVYQNYKNRFIYHHFYYSPAFRGLLRDRGDYIRFYNYHYPRYFFKPYYRPYYYNYYNYYIDP